MHRIIWTLILLLSIHVLFAQENQRSYEVYINDHTELPEPEEQWESIKQSTEALYDGQVYALIQLNTIPTEEGKRNLTQSGITLLHYVPNYAWIAKLSPAITTTTLTSLGVRKISRIQTSWKIPTEMATASPNESLSVRILFWEIPTNQSLEALSTKMGAKVLSTSQHWVDATIMGNQLANITQHPLVQYIEWTEITPIPEIILDQSERAISTYISNNPGKAYYFDGSGVRIAVEEGGIVDTVENPNFRSRLNRSNESVTNVSGHKTGVGLRMASAGNIDPKERGTAFGAELYSGGMNFTNAATSLITILNRSVGWGCPSGSEIYNSTSVSYDNLAYSYPTFTITHSAGNIGGTSCYANNIPDWGNITGLPKMAKNIFVVGATGSDGTLTGFSSRGPAKDGRILPNIVAPGDGGTSHATPNLAGVFAQLNQAYRHHNSGTIPQAGLLKAVIMNTADDMENPGPDFRTGYGSINGRRAYEVVRQGQIITSNISQGANNTHTITVPANVKEVRVLTYWTDYPATAGITTKALVNDLDMVLTDPNAQTYQPWVLNPAFNIATLNNPAVQATDNLNNVEQITINNPVAGTYNLNLAGTIVPQGPQTYFVTYEFVFDEIVITHPHGGEKLVPAEIERIRWDANKGVAPFDLAYSLDNGGSWTTIATGINADSRYYDWTIPAAITDAAKIRVTRGAIMGESDTTFTIYEQTENLQLIWSCADSSLFYWDELAGADGYVAYRIVGDYMDSVGYTTTNSIILNGLSLSEKEYISIASHKDGITSRRVIALERLPSDLNCIEDEVGTFAIINPSVQNMPSCMLSGNDQLIVSIRNWGTNEVDSIFVAYQLNGGTIFWDTLLASLSSGVVDTLTFGQSMNFLTGTNTITVWTALPGDVNSSNDTLEQNIIFYPTSGSATVITEDFDNFATCSTAWGCEEMSCLLQNDWYNVPNLSGDDIDWRVDSDGTGTGDTGPSGDHTTGNGNYLYLEGSGNGGSGCRNHTAMLYSPCVDLTATNIGKVSFWYHAYGSAIGELHVDVLSEGEIFEDVMPPIIGDQGDQWKYAEADLSAFGGNQIVVIIRGSTGNGFRADLAIDDINILAGPKADFQATETQLCDGQTTILNNNSIMADSYEWTITPATHTYLNGTDSTSANPEVLFTDGLYTVQLAATNAAGTDTLALTDYIYVWGNAPSLSPVTDYCAGDSIIIAGNNNGQPVDYYLNQMLVNSGSADQHYYQSAQHGDTVYAVYPVNSGCLLYSDTLVLNITTVDTMVSRQGLTLSSTNTNASDYQWIDCNNGGAPIPGATDSSFTAAINGTYALVVTENGCVGTSACYTIDNVGIETLLDETSVSIYPNPTTGTFSIAFETVQAEVEIVITNSLGQIISTQHLANTKNIEASIDTAPGIYTVMIRATSGQVVKSLIKR